MDVMPAAAVTITVMIGMFPDIGKHVGVIPEAVLIMTYGMRITVGMIAGGGMLSVTAIGIRINPLVQVSVIAESLTITVIIQMILRHVMLVHVDRTVILIMIYGMRITVGMIAGGRVSSVTAIGIRISPIVQMSVVVT